MRRTPGASRRSLLSLRTLAELARSDRAGGIAMAAATVVALVWANWPGSDSYRRTWEATVGSAGILTPAMSVQQLIDQVLLVAFFAVIGLEIRRELSAGELASWRRAAVPVLAALGGMAAPALIYTAVTAGPVGAGGWGIPMATDVAFALGALALIAGPGSTRARVFLMTLAVADDIVSIVVLTIFYGNGQVRFEWVVAALAALSAMLAVRLLGVASGLLQVILGAVAWWAMLQAGLEAAVVGVAVGVLGASAVAARRESSSTPVTFGARWWELRLEPWVNLVVLPVFALANVGVRFAGSGLLSENGIVILAAVAAARLVGKPLGIALTTRTTSRRSSETYDPGLPGRAVVGIGSIAAVGFTVPLLILHNSLHSEAQIAGATVGLLGASVLGALGGILVWPRRRPRQAAPAPGPGGAG